MDDIPLPLPFLMDGVSKTTVKTLEIPSGVCPEQWIADHPDGLIATQRECCLAGANVLSTPTWGANPPMLEPFGLGGQTWELNGSLAALPFEAASGSVPAAGVLSRTGLPVPPLGHTDFETIVNVYALQARALERAGVSFFLAESMGSMAEARAALLAVRENTSKPILITFSCDGDGHIPSGGDILAALIICQGMGAFAFGIGSFTGSLCDLGTQIQRLYFCTHIPLAVNCDYRLLAPSCSPDEAAAFVPVLAQAGVRIFGGAADPSFIAALRGAMDRLDFSRFSFAKQDPGALYCASEWEAQFISPLIDVGKAIEISPSFAEDLLSAEGAAGGATKLFLSEENDLYIFAENQYIIQDALCLSSHSLQLMERALRLYNGRAFYDGTGDLNPEDLAPLVRKYGLVVL
ncbi:MAG: homocysteine S-methyltransferase family protein [Oscillospiraceae bacterium]|nr:homocysteine S-methyltransferase family protein [Oscillospiraceae bacterium]